MPINYKDYPDNWKEEIRPAILKRENYRCKFCGVRHKAYGIRDEKGQFIELDKTDKDAVIKSGKKFIRVILTIAHLDHNIQNNDFSNLAALCQKCHNNYDKEYRIAKRRINKLKSN
jgi:5-methylcytosine-specific restriction endonuclease McrA